MATDSSSTATIAYADGGSLPPGLAIDPVSGSITGTPTTAGTYPVTITATDSAGFSATASFNWTVTNVVSETPTGDQNSVSGSAITPVTAVATDSSSTATIAYADGGSLPPGLAIDPVSGSITGTPTTAGTYPVTITATDSAGFSATASFNWTVSNNVSVTAPVAPTAPTGSPITPLTLADHDTSTTASITGWAASGLPSGLSIDTSTGAISGTPTTAGNYFGVTVTASDSAGYSGSARFEWRITNTVVVAPIADQATDTFAPVTPIVPAVTDSQVSPPVTFTWTATGLPAGLSIDRPSGTISGTPTAAGTYPVTITASDSAMPKQSGSSSFTWTVTDVAPAVTGVTPTSGVGAGGATVKISGTNFQGATSVLFGTTPATISNVNGAGTQITVAAPAHATGTVDVTVTARTETSAITSSDHFTYIGPGITSMSRTGGSTVGGVKIKIVGTGLTGATAVDFGSTPATSVKANKKGTQITAVVPTHAAGAVDVTVTTPSGSSAAVAADVYLYAGPSITSISPSSGLPAGGKKVTITGTDLNGATSVHFGSTPASSFTVNGSGTAIKVVVPPGTAGIGRHHGDDPGCHISYHQC